MVRVHAQTISGTKALVDRGALDSLIEVTRCLEGVELAETKNDPCLAETARTSWSY